MKSLRLDARGLLFILIWTSGYLGGAIVATEMSPLATNLWRFLGAAVVLGALALRRRERWPRTPRAMAAAALLGFLVFAVQLAGSTPAWPRASLPRRRPSSPAPRPCSSP